MIEKLLTLISGNTLLVRKAVEDVKDAFTGAIESLRAENSQSTEKVTSELSRMSDAMYGMGEAVRSQPPIQVSVPDVIVPEIVIPEIKVPDIHLNVPDVIVPEIKIPTINVPTPQVTVEPKIEVHPTPVTFPNEMQVTGLAEGLKMVVDTLNDHEGGKEVYSQDNPLPVAFIDRKGRRYDLTHLGSAVSTGGGGTASGGATEAKQDDLIAAVSALGGAKYALRLDEASATVTYVGEAAIASATSSAVWRIKKIDSTSGLVITWADGDELFNNVWDDRASLSYS